MPSFQHHLPRKLPKVARSLNGPASSTGQNGRTHHSWFAVKRMALCEGQVREFLTPCCRPPKHRQDPSALQKQSGTGLSRQGSYDPSAWALSPRDFFTTNPFTLMRRMTEDMDCIFGQ